LSFLGCIDPRRGYPSFYGKKGLKTQRDFFGEKDKILCINLPYASPRDPLVSNEMFIYMKKGTHKNND
jgi:hypothetical protein